MADYKPGVSGVPSPEISRAISVADGIYASHGVKLVVTSIRDGKHSSGSLHYSGRAADLRIWELNAKGKTNIVVGQLKNALGSDFDVILESDHIHVEYDPQGGAGSSATSGGSSATVAGFPVSWLIVAIVALVILRK